MKKIIFVAMLSLMLLVFSLPAVAANDDPGEGRLSSGASPEFYESPIAASSADDVILSYYTYRSPLTGLSYTLRQGGEVLNGIDVSVYQETIDWKKVKNAGVDFVIIRCAGRGYGAEGNIFDDDNFAKNIKGASEAGLDVGVYFFSQAITKEEAVEEAEHMLELVKGYDVTLPLVMDYEYSPSSTSGRLYNAKLSKSEATAVCRAFCERIKAAGYESMVYANKSMLTDHINGKELGKDYKIWLANYTTDTTYDGSYQFWQYSETGTVDGINGRVDCNFLFYDDGIVLPFQDVRNSDWFYSDVKYVYENKIMNGVAASYFAPKDKMERSMVATILYRMSKAPAPTYQNVFSDVPDGQWFTEGIVWSYQNGVVDGYGNGIFGPNDSISREQFATMLYRYAKFCGYDTSSSASLSQFKDAGSISQYALNAMKWAVAKGYINGTSSTLLEPNGTATRAQCAAMMTRFMMANS